jgi:O-acetyl-ADP-ribose deacetylase (regulator of RNase III)
MAFPNISTGIYKFPKEKAASIAVNAVSKYLEGHPEIERVIFVCFDKENFELYKQLV